MKGPCWLNIKFPRECDFLYSHNLPTLECIVNVKRNKTLILANGTLVILAPRMNLILIFNLFSLELPQQPVSWCKVEVSVLLLLYSLSNISVPNF